MTLRKGAASIAQWIPGLVVAALLGWLSVWSADWLGRTLLGLDRSPISAVMVALVLGLITRTILRMPTVLTSGLKLASKHVLRLGIILLGARLAVIDVLEMGELGVPIVLLCVFGALLVSLGLSRWLRLPARLGTLIAVGTSICGVSAVLATASVIEAEEQECAYAVAIVTVFGLVATIAYPFAADWIFSGVPNKVGLFLGTSIHDTSQVIGAAQAYADIFRQTSALDVATVTKLLRNLLMVGVIPAISCFHVRRVQASGKRGSVVRLFPLFVLGFLALAALRSIGDAGLGSNGLALGLWDNEGWNALVSNLKTLSGYCLVTALAGVGLRTDVRSFKGLGIKPFVVGLVAALAVGAISFTAITLLVSG